MAFFNPYSSDTSAIQQFVAQFESSVPNKNVRVNLTVDTDVLTNQAQYDCFYLPDNAVPSIDTQTLLNFDPLLAADPSFQAQEYMGNIFGNVRRQNKLWALPIGIQPDVIWYSKVLLSGTNAPTSNWNASTFQTLLDSLKGVTQTAQPFTDANMGSQASTFLALVAAYGGVPIDWRTTPPIANFTSPANIAAMRNVLALIKQGDINYVSPNKVSSLSMTPNLVPLYSNLVSTFDIETTAQADRFDMRNRGFVLFAQNLTFKTIAYQTATAYITAKSANPSLCYQWITALSQRPELLGLLPARRSQMDTLINSAGSSQPLYDALETVLNAPNTLEIPVDGDVTARVLEHWLFQAWDAYFAGSADLETPLKNAQDLANGYLTCAADVNASNIVQDEKQRQAALLGCAVKVDPTYK